MSVAEPPKSFDASEHGVDATLLLTALSALKKGDFTARLPISWTGIAGKVADTFNDVVELNERMANELGRLGARWVARGASSSGPAWVK